MAEKATPNAPASETENVPASKSMIDDADFTASRLAAEQHALLAAENEHARIAAEQRDAASKSTETSVGNTMSVEADVSKQVNVEVEVSGGNAVDAPGAPRPSSPGASVEQDANEKPPQAHEPENAVRPTQEPAAANAPATETSETAVPAPPTAAAVAAAAFAADLGGKIELDNDGSDNDGSDDDREPDEKQRRGPGAMRARLDVDDVRRFPGTLRGQTVARAIARALQRLATEKNLNLESETRTRGDRRTKWRRMTRLLGDVALEVMEVSNILDVESRWGNRQVSTAEHVYDMLSNLRAEEPDMSLREILAMIGLIDFELGRERPMEPLMLGVRGDLLHTADDFGDEDLAATVEEEILNVKTISEAFEFRQQHGDNLRLASAFIFIRLFPASNLFFTTDSDSDSDTDGTDDGEKLTDLMCDAAAGLLTWIIRDRGLVQSDAPFRHFSP